MICRKLVARGLITRLDGPGGRIINVPVSHDDSACEAPSEGITHAWELPPFDAATTALVVPCSAGKDGRGATDHLRSVFDSLPREHAQLLRAARAAHRSTASMSDDELVPAAWRYSGAFWQEAGPAIRLLVA